MTFDHDVYILQSRWIMTLENDIGEYHSRMLHLALTSQWMCLAFAPLRLHVRAGLDWGSVEWDSMKHSQFKCIAIQMHRGIHTPTMHVCAVTRVYTDKTAIAKWLDILMLICDILMTWHIHDLTYSCSWLDIFMTWHIHVHDLTYSWLDIFMFMTWHIHDLTYSHLTYWYVHLARRGVCREALTHTHIPYYPYTLEPRRTVFANKRPLFSGGARGDAWLSYQGPRHAHLFAFYVSRDPLIYASYDSDVGIVWLFRVCGVALRVLTSLAPVSWPMHTCHVTHW